MSDNKITANFTASSSNFNAGADAVKSKLNELNTAYEQTRQAVSDTNKEIKALQKQQAQLAAEMKNGGTAEQRSQMQALSDKITQANVKLGSLKTTEIELKQNIKNTSSALTEQKNSTTQVKDATDKTTASLSSMKAVFMSIVAGYAGKTLYQALIGSNAEMEQYITSFEVMLGSADKAKKMMSDLTDFAAHTPMTLTDTVATGTLLMNYGVSDSDLIDTMTQLGDLSSGNADKLNRVALAYGQMLAKGKVSGEELRQMTEAGIPLLQTLADSMGKTTAETQKLISAGSVGIPQLNDAIESLTTGTGKFAGMMQKQSETLNGMLSTAKDRIEQFGRDVGEQTFNEVKQTLSDILAEVDRMRDSGELDDIAKDIGTTVNNLVVALKNLAVFIWDNKDAIAALTVGVIAFKGAITVGNFIATAVTTFNALKTALTGANAAQIALNASAAANPYVFAASAILAVASAIGVLAATSNTASQSADQLAQATDDLGKNIDKSMQSTEADIAILKAKVKQYDNLRTAENLTSEQETTLKNLASDLQATFGDSVNVVDSLTGSYNNLTDALNNYVDKQMQATKLSAYQEAAKQAYININDISTQKNDASDKYAEAYGSFLNAGFSGDPNNQNAYTKPLFDIFGVNAAKDAYDTLVAVEKENQAIIDQYESMIEGSYTGLEDTVKTNNDIQKVSVKTSEEMAEATQKTSEAFTQLLSDYKQYNNALSEWQSNGNLSADTAQKMIETGYGAALSYNAQTKEIQLNIEAYKALVSTKADAQKEVQELERTELELLNAELSRRAAHAGQAGDTALLAEISSQITANQNRIDALAAIQNIVMPSMSYDGYGSSELDNAVDDTLDKINAEIDAKKELRDLTIAAIDEEIAKRKELNEDTDYQDELDKINAQLKYSQLDDFSRANLQKQRQSLIDDHDETLWTRSMQDKKDAVNDWYNAAETAAKSTEDNVTLSIANVNALLSALSNGIANITNVTNNSSNSNQAYINFSNSALTASQVEDIIRRYLGDPIIS